MVAAMAACGGAPAAGAEGASPAEGVASSAAVSPSPADGWAGGPAVGHERARTFVTLDAADPDEPAAGRPGAAAIRPKSSVAEQQVVAIPFPPAARLLVPGTAMAAWAVYRFNRPRRPRASR